MARSEDEAAVREPGWTITSGPGPLIATAIHDGHELRPELRPLIALDEEARLREEDPFTARWTEIACTRVVAHRSRFEVDLNRPVEKSVYRTPAEAWGLRVWKEPLPQRFLERSWAAHDAFYAELRRLLDGKVAEHGRFVVLDLHSYNHRRAGPQAAADEPAANPDVNLGTGSMDRARWAGVADAFLGAMAGEWVAGRALDVRENVRFQGGWLTRWVHETYPQRGCALAIEIKKIFMDEWSGLLDLDAWADVRAALGRAAAAVEEALGAVGAKRG